jgi:hypothetical protein
MIMVSLSVSSRRVQALSQAPSPCPGDREALEARCSHLEPFEKRGIADEAILDNLAKATSELTVWQRVQRVDVAENASRLSADQTGKKA